MKNNQSFPYYLVIMVVVMTSILLAVSARHQNFNDYSSCRGGYGVGFPTSFMCDYGAGGSPISGWGRIDSSDFPYFSPRGVAIDFTFYFAILLGLACLIQALAYLTGAIPQASKRWTISFTIAFIGTLFMVFLVMPYQIKYQDVFLGVSPTAILFTPTSTVSPTPGGTPTAVATFSAPPTPTETRVAVPPIP